MPQPQKTQQHALDSDVPKWHISVAPHFAALFNDAVGTRVGYGAGGQVTRALVSVGRARFGVGFDFGYDRFQHDTTTKFVDMSGATITITSTEFVSHATFAGLLVIDAIAGRVRPWVAIGAGISVGDYEGPGVTPGKAINDVGVAGLVKICGGFGVRVYQGFEIGLRTDFNLTISSENQRGVTIWQPGFFAGGLDLGYRF